MNYYRKNPGLIRKAGLLLIPVIILIAFYSCGSAEGDFNKLLGKYTAGDTSVSENMHEKLLEAFSAAVFDSDDIFFTKNLLLRSGGDEPEIIYPKRMTLDADDSIDDNLTFAAMNGSFILLGNNKGFCLFNHDGEPVSIFKAEAKSTLDAMSLKNHSVIYLSKGRLYEYSIDQKTSRLFDSGEFFAPYKKYFRAYIYSSVKYGALITGIAGSYYISVYDIENGGIKAKNIEASAFDVAIRGNTLYYVRGGAGNWAVMKYDIVNKNKSQVRQVSKLDGVHVTGTGFICMADGKGKIEGYSGEKGTIPAEWTIRGTCDDMVLVEYEGKIYFMEFAVLLEKLRMISSAAKKG